MEKLINKLRPRSKPKMLFIAILATISLTACATNRVLNEPKKEQQKTSKQHDLKCFTIFMKEWPFIHCY